MKSLNNEQDVQSTKKAMEQAPSWFLSIPDKKTPWYFISLDYADGFVHWYDAGQGSRRIVCAGGLEGKGFATAECLICAHVLALYQESKRLSEEGEDSKAKQLKDRANRLHGKPEVQFKVIRGQRTLIKDPKTGKKEWVADWDMEDEDSTAAVGIMSMSESQFAGFTGMIKGEGTEFIESGSDLGNRVLWTAKESRKGKRGGKYSAVVWSADEEESAMPEIEIPEELIEMDLTENFQIDEEEVDKVHRLLSGEEIEEPEEDDEVEVEDDTAEEDEPDNDDLDDLDDDEDPEPDDESEEEEEDELPFEDDIPEEPKKKASTAKPASKKAAPKAAVKKGSTTTKKSTARKSGKARM